MAEKKDVQDVGSANRDLDGLLEEKGKNKYEPE